MSERLPYEQHLNEQWNEIPLPDENMAWDDMKRRLEEDDDDPVVFWWRPGCALGGLLLVVLLGIGWWYMRSGKEDKGEKGVKENVFVGDSVADKKRNNNKGSENNISTDTSLVDVNESGSRVKQAVKQERPKATKNPKVATRRKAGDPEETGSTIVSENSTAETQITKIDSAVAMPEPEPQKTDSVKKELTDSTKAQKKNPEDSSKKRNLFFSAGIAMQQQLPIAGQKLTPYNALGRKGSLADYLPSIYVRLNRKDKWFIQAEFKYGAPQYTKEFTYQQQIVQDTGSTPDFEIRTTDKLRKSFYHQLPLTFNYYVMPDWSVGGGLVWNKFYGVVSDREVVKFDNILNDTVVISKGTYGTRTDSFNVFAKSYFQGVIETQYRWKRFSIGARYTFGLEPYIKFTLPGGAQQKERNQNLNLFLRYELWRQKDKK